MHLVACATPPEPLEDAPRSALLGDAIDGECWDAFWSSDAYVVRCTRTGGEIEWFAVADDEAPAGSRGTESRILAIRPKTRPQSRVSVVVAQSPDGRRMLIGGSARRPAR
jgi:hypothetical protein